MPVLWLTVLAACGGVDAPDPPHHVVHATVDLRGTWRKLASRTEGARQVPVTWTADWSLPESRLAPGAVLVLEGLNYRAQVELNGTALDPVFGGIGPLELPVGPLLRAGDNHLVVTVPSPAEENRALTALGERSFRLRRPPVLRLQPELALDTPMVSFTEDGAQASVATPAATPGTRVQLRAMLDGRQLADFGTADVEGGLVLTAPRRWPGKRWSPVGPGQRELFWLVATLSGPDGEVLEVASVRTGLREVGLDEDGLTLDGEEWPLLAVRADYLADLGPQLAAVGDAANALELHGEPYDRRFYDLADELGLPLVVTPRCDGRAQLTSREVWDLREELWEQNRRFLRAAARHPSVVLWVAEGDAAAGGVLGQAFAKDPAGRLLVGRDLPGVPVAVMPGERVITDFPDEPWWIVEMGYAPGATDAGVPRALEAAFRLGSSGGVVPGPAQVRDEGHWGTLSATLGAMLEEQGGKTRSARRRAPARVQVIGLREGQVAWVEAAGLPTHGAVAGPSGTTVLDVWHDGPATVTVGETSWDVELEAGAWVGQTWTGKIALVRARSDGA